MMETGIYLQQPSSGKVHVSFREFWGLLLPYAGKRIGEQSKAVLFLVLYLILFQTIILGIPIAEVLVIAGGLGAVILGLSFFLEGLILGLMPLGEMVGLQLPRKASLSMVLAFGFILGLGATFAEPAIGVLKTAGASVKAWEAPLLFLLLGRYAHYLVYAVGIGVGFAVILGLIRFYYDWSLKPYIIILTLLLCGMTLASYFSPNLQLLTGIAWDCGGITTGPVTVPLVLALGIGICRAVGSNRSDTGGFGIVTLASLLPVAAVLGLGLYFLAKVPAPMTAADFCRKEVREKIKILFPTQESLIGYVMTQMGPAELEIFLGESADSVNQFIQSLAQDPKLQQRVFGIEPAAFKKWIVSKGLPEQSLSLLQDGNSSGEFQNKRLHLSKSGLFLRNMIVAVQAILPLAFLLMIVLLWFLRARVPRKDEVLFGIFLGLIGLSFFNIGIETGLTKLGNQVGQMLPSSFEEIPLAAQRKTIENFDTSLVQTAIRADGKKERFFYEYKGKEYLRRSFDPHYYDPQTKTYTFIPSRGPLFAFRQGMLGVLLVVVFGFFLGYGATLAEPALNALGIKVQELTVGRFKKRILTHSVASGVGLGTALGVIKVVWAIPLSLLLLPPYFILIFLTLFSKDEFVEIGWDSAGVTTGPVTVPLVLAMGLGLGQAVGVVEGFGILALASVYPILTVLLVGLLLQHKGGAVSNPSLAEGEKIS